MPGKPGSEFTLGMTMWCRTPGGVETYLQTTTFFSFGSSSAAAAEKSVPADGVATEAAFLVGVFGASTGAAGVAGSASSVLVAPVGLSGFPAGLSSDDEPDPPWSGSLVGFGSGFGAGLGSGAGFGSGAGAGVSLTAGVPGSESTSSASAGAAKAVEASTTAGRRSAIPRPLRRERRAELDIMGQTPSVAFEGRRDRSERVRTGGVRAPKKEHRDSVRAPPPTGYQRSLSGHGQLPSGGGGQTHLQTRDQSPDPMAVLG
ncbi:hypothetical protein F9L07_23635 [Pimelobacter simplex]|uniref:Uncharacterized protein n=1 Tax=Nocardioides simplex TaxID=2045 RepID=A0A7J5DTK5_NOCSI|nr:hypothetical protein F9L07_23635 [Pimelobacter simplex]